MSAEGRCGVAILGSTWKFDCMKKAARSGDLTANYAFESRSIFTVQTNLHPTRGDQ